MPAPRKSYRGTVTGSTDAVGDASCEALSYGAAAAANPSIDAPRGAIDCASEPRCEDASDDLDASSSAF